jgi:hypothetical protein
VKFHALSFEEVALGPGQKREVRAQCTDAFRPQRLVLIGEIREIRGFFRIKRSRLPSLDRDQVIAYSNVTRAPSRRRTTVEYREGVTGNFVRQYRPESVVYEHVDPLSYVGLTDILVGTAPQMPSLGEGVSAARFSTGCFGNGLPLSTVADGMWVSLCFANRGDVEVRVNASLLGRGL